MAAIIPARTGIERFRFFGVGRARAIDTPGGTPIRLGSLARSAPGVPSRTLLKQESPVFINLIFHY